MKRLHHTLRDVAREILAAVPPPQLAALCRRVPEVRQLRDRIDAPGFATPDELARADRICTDAWTIKRDGLLL